jgi:DHA1 family bicyclomycin/chloramphenicol resistance-like MFS transporter
MTPTSQPITTARPVRRIFQDGQMPVWLIILLGSLSAVGPLSTDMYLPAFPTLERSLGSGSGSAQITLAAWFVGLAVGQFTQGPASDRWGRKLPLLVGLAIYTIGSIGCAVSHDLWSFSACRFLAALGGSAGMVIPRAIVRDVATGTQGAKLMSQLTLVLGVVPVLAPSLGALVLTIASWRWIFGIATFYGVVSLTIVYLTLPDTLPRSMRLHLAPVEVLGRYISIFNERVFLTNTCICGFSSFVVFAYLSGTPIVFEEILHFTPTGFGLMFGINAFFYILGTQVNARIVGRVGVERMLGYGILSMTGAAVLLTLMVLTGLAGPHGTIIAAAFPIMWVMASLGFLTPNAVVLALTAHARHAGSASALLGTLQFSFGALAGVVMGIFSNISMVPMALVILVGVIGANIAHRARRPEPLVD